MKILKILRGAAIIIIGLFLAFALAIFACSLIGKAGLPVDAETGLMAFASFSVAAVVGLIIANRFPVV